MSAAQMDPHDKMRARDVSKVTRGEQAPRPAPPSSTDHYLDANKNKKVDRPGKAENGAESPSNNYQTRHCYVKYVEYQRCIQQKGEKAPECEKLATHFRSICPTELIEEWDKEREEGMFPGET